MIIVRLSGGLGNQMFQYAAGRRLALMHAVPLKFDLSGFSAPGPGETVREYALDVFRISAEPAQPQEVAALSAPAQPRLGNLCGILKEVLVPLKKRSYYKERHFQFDPALLRLGSNVYLHGCWQSEKYFRDAQEQIRNDFSFTLPLEGKNLQLSELIGATNSVSLHVRRSDYVTNPVSGQYHGTCPVEFYLRALELVARRTDQTRLFIFSDDMDWVRENLSLPSSATFVDHNGPDKGFEDLRLMSLCKHNIIANSSFSWWGAWLNRNPEKQVVAPAKWFNRRDISTADLIPSGWHRI